MGWRIRGLLAVATVLLAGGTVQAALAPEYYLRARVAAPHHIQMQVTKVELDAAEPGTCTVHGRIAQVFRGPLPLDVPVHFIVHCLTSTAQPMPGAAQWFFPDALSKATVVEGFFQGDLPQLIPALDQLSPVEAVRERPWCATERFVCDLP